MLVDEKSVVEAATLERRDLVTELVHNVICHMIDVLLIYWSDRSLGGILDGLCGELGVGLWRGCEANDVGRIPAMPRPHSLSLLLKASMNAAVDEGPLVAPLEDPSAGASTVTESSRTDDSSTLTLAAADGDNEVEPCREGEEKLWIRDNTSIFSSFSSSSCFSSLTSASSPRTRSSRDSV